MEELHLLCTVLSPPRQHSYLRRCWSGGEPFACKIWPAFEIWTLDLPHARHTRKSFRHQGGEM